MAFLIILLILACFIGYSISFHFPDNESKQFTQINFFETALNQTNNKTDIIFRDLEFEPEVIKITIIGCDNLSKEIHVEVEGFNINYTWKDFCIKLIQ